MQNIWELSVNIKNKNIMPDSNNIKMTDYAIYRVSGTTEKQIGIDIVPSSPEQCRSIIKGIVRESETNPDFEIESESDFTFKPIHL